MLPTSKSSIKTELWEYHWLIYGPPKVGKTTFVSQFNDPLFICTENRHKHLQVYKIPQEGAISNWQGILDAFKNIKNEVDAGKFKWKTIVIDTIDNAWRYCREYSNAKLGIEHESEASFGKGWEACKTEFFRVMSKITSLGIAVIFISHSKDKVKITRMGEETRFAPSLDEKAKEIILPLIDILGAVVFKETDGNKDSRVLVLQGSEYIEAGCPTPKLMPAQVALDYKELEKIFKKNQEVKK